MSAPIMYFPPACWYFSSCFGWETLNDTIMPLWFCCGVSWPLFTCYGCKPSQAEVTCRKQLCGWTGGGYSCEVSAGETLPASDYNQGTKVQWKCLYSLFHSQNLVQEERVKKSRRDRVCKKKWRQCDGEKAKRARKRFASGKSKRSWKDGDTEWRHEWQSFPRERGWEFSPPNLPGVRGGKTDETGQDHPAISSNPDTLTLQSGLRDDIWTWTLWPAEAFQATSQDLKHKSFHWTTTICASQNVNYP